MKRKKTVVPHRRRREGKTDYRKRRQLLMGEKPRLVVRLTNAGVVAQILSYHPQGDKVIAACHSQSLKKLGWQKPAANLPSAYLTGVLVGSKAKKQGVEQAILDTGLSKPVKGSRIYAVLKGAIDAGISIPHQEDILPNPDRLAGKHIDESLISSIETVKKKIEALS